MNLLTTSEPSPIYKTKSDLRELLQTNYAEILFTKKDGTKRLMKCTLREGDVIHYEKKTERTVKTNEQTIAVWDLEAAGWRTINLDTIESVKVY